MKIEVGKHYKTRHGAKVFIVGREPFCGLFVVASQSGRLYPVFDDGHEFLRSDCTSEWDLVSEWREPVSLTKTIYLIREPNGCTDTWTKEENQVPGCLDRPDHVLLAKKTITITEGDGMESSP